LFITSLDSEKINIDVEFRHPNGGSISLEELRAGVPPVIEPFVFEKAREARWLVAGRAAIGTDHQAGDIHGLEVSESQ
jgi:hypothetical protein